MEQGQQKNTESLILEAAKKVFIQKGYAGARMQEIADEAQINKSMLHYYFRSKALLFDKIMNDSLDLMAPQFIAAISGEGSVMEKMERLVHTYIDNILQNPHTPLFILSELSQNSLKYVSKIKEKIHGPHVFDELNKQILQEQAEGIIKPIPPHHLILTVMSLIVFPFIAKPIFLHILDIPENNFQYMMEERKQILIQILRDAILM